MLRLSLALAGLGVLAQAVPSDPAAGFLSLGVAGLICGVFFLWNRDLTKQRDKAQAALDKVQPLLEQIREALVASTDAHRAGIEASREASRAIRDLPSRETWFKVIAALERMEK